MANADLAPMLSQFAAAYGCMLVIPGPNALVVLQSSGGRSARQPLLAASGVASGAALASLLAASSAAALPQGTGFRALSGVIVAIILLRAAFRVSAVTPAVPRSSGPAKPHTGLEPFVLGFGASLLNPLSVPYFASFFVSHACTRLGAALACGVVFMMAGIWFASLGLVSSRLQRLALPQSCRRAGNLAVAGTLVVLASHHLWIAVFP